MAGLDLARHGLRWTHAGHVLAHPRPDGPAAVLDRDVEVTAASLDVDASAYRRLHRRLVQGVGSAARRAAGPVPPDPLLDPLAAHAEGGRHCATWRVSRCCRFGGSSKRSSRGPVPGCCSPASPCTPISRLDAAGSALFGWLLAGLGQQHGFPVPVGGAGRHHRRVGGTRRSGRRDDPLRHEGRPHRRQRRPGNRCRHGARGPGAARHAVLADCDARHLLLSMVGSRPPSVRGRASVRIASSAARPRSSSTGPCGRRSRGRTRPPAAPGPCTSRRAWTSCRARRPSWRLGLIPAEPFLLVGQMTTADPTRSPPGTESAWAYTHVPMTHARGRRRRRHLGDLGRRRRATVRRSDGTADRVAGTRVHRARSSPGT